MRRSETGIVDQVHCHNVFVTFKNLFAFSSKNKRNVIGRLLLCDGEAIENLLTLSACKTAILVS